MAGNTDGRRITRRAFLSGTAAGAGLLWLQSCAHSTEPPARFSVRPHFVQVVAHEDDDILFMNPDLAASIQAGHPVTTIYVTAGEASPTDAAAASAYTARRQAGARAAYAAMAGVADSWHAEVLALDDAHEVEVYTLAPRPLVTLVFLDLPENADALAPGGPRTMARLVGDPNVATQSLVPDASHVRSSRYDQDSLVRALTSLFVRFQPTVVRSQDSIPDAQHVADAQWQPFHDHPDHVSVAQLVELAARAFRDSAMCAPFVQVRYRDYNTAEMAHNLSPAEQHAKLVTLAAYLRHDEKSTAVPPVVDWARSMYYRWPRGTTWTALDAQGRLHALAGRAGELVAWRRDRDGTWTGTGGVGDLRTIAPSISIVKDRGGNLHALARRLDDHTIVVMSALADGTWPASWTSLGTPSPGDNRAQLGAPIGVATATGIAVFVRNGGSGVSGKTRNDGRWDDAWGDLMGFDVQDPMCALALDDGTIELFAATSQKVLRWTQAHAGAPLALDAGFPSVRPAGPPVASQLGRELAVHYRAADAELVTSARAATGAWSAPRSVAPRCGVGGPAVVIAKGTDGAARRVLCARDEATGAAIAIEDDAGALGPWQAIGGDLVDYPTAVVDHAGAIVVLGIGADGQLHVCEQLRAGAGAPFGHWQLVEA